MTLLHVIRTGNGRSSMPQIMLKTAINPPAALGTSGTGPQKVTGALQLLKLTTASVRCLLLTNTTWPRNHRSSDASAFSTEDLTRLQAGICQQLSDRARQASQQQPVRTSRGVEPPESIGVADPYLPASQPCSSADKEKPIFELVAE